MVFPHASSAIDQTTNHRSDQRCSFMLSAYQRVRALTVRHSNGLSSIEAERPEYVGCKHGRFMAAQILKAIGGPAIHILLATAQ